MDSDKEPRLAEMVDVGLGGLGSPVPSPPKHSPSSHDNPGPSLIPSQTSPEHDYCDGKTKQANLDLQPQSRVAKSENLEKLDSSPPSKPPPTPRQRLAQLPETPVRMSSLFDPLDTSIETDERVLQITLRNLTASKVWGEANAVFVKGDIHGALRKYTDILTNISPGYPAAFLNRALCYLALDHPSLAVVDCYRAYQGAEWARKAEHGLKYRNMIVSACKVTESCARNKVAWALEPACYPGLPNTLLGQRLASLTLQKRRRFKRVRRSQAEFLQDDPDAHELLSETSLSMAGLAEVFPDASLPDDVQMKALYRLAVALWKCGGGAIKTIETVLTTAHSLKDDEEDSESLGFIENKYWIYLADKFAQEKREAFQDRNAESDEGFRGLLNTQYTRIKRQLYPWDEWTLSTTNAGMLVPSLSRTIVEGTRNCYVKGNPRDGKTPYLTLHALRDIPRGTALYNEVTHFNVRNIQIGTVFMYCDNCGVAMDVPDDAVILANKRAHNDYEQYKSERAAARSLQDQAKAAEASAANSKLFEEVRADTQQTESLQTPPNSDDSVGKATEVEEDNVSPTTTGPSSPIIHGSGSSASLKASSAYTETASHASRIPPPPKPPAFVYDSSLPQTREDFNLCAFCLSCAYCSTKCNANASAGYHIPHCDKNLEGHTRFYNGKNQWLDDPGRGGIINRPAYRFGASDDEGFNGYIPSPNRQQLLLLLLQRILGVKSPNPPLSESWYQILDASLVETSECPFGSGEIGSNQSWLTTWSDDPPSVETLFPPVSADPQHDDGMIAWSYDNNVARPLMYLFATGGHEDFMDVRRFDGWMLNTLLAKLETNMRVVRYPKQMKSFNEFGNISGVEFDVLEDYEAMQNDFGEPSQQPDDLWTATLHPLSALLRTPEEMKTTKSKQRGSSEPNTTIWEVAGQTMCTTTADAKPRRRQSSSVEEDTKMSTDKPRKRQKLEDDIAIHEHEALVRGGIWAPPAEKRKDSVIGMPEINTAFDHNLAWSKAPTTDRRRGTRTVSINLWRKHSRESGDARNEIAYFEGSETDVDDDDMADTLIAASQTIFSAEAEMDDEEHPMADDDMDFDDEDPKMYEGGTGDERIGSDEWDGTRV